DQAHRRNCNPTSVFKGSAGFVARTWCVCSKTSTRNGAEIYAGHRLFSGGSAQKRLVAAIPTLVSFAKSAFDACGHRPNIFPGTDSNYSGTHNAGCGRKIITGK